MEIFCFFLGVLYFYTAHLYVPISALAIFYIYPRYPVILFFIAGISIAWIHHHLSLTKGLPDSTIIPYATIEGKVVSIPQMSSHKTQFLFELEQFNQHPAQGVLQLSWYNKAPIVHAGQRWHLVVKLKKPRNFLNPGSFDYVSSLSKKHIYWTGYIRNHGNFLLNKSTTHFDWFELRERLADKLNLLAPNQSSAGVIEALALNVTRHISQDNWELFRRTGTIHLFGISGEHIALISGLVYYLCRWLWTRSARCCLLFPASSIASVMGLGAAVFYAFLAGFEPPVQRALIGCCCYTLYSIGIQRLSPWQAWRYALFAVLCLEPHAVLMQGFYFSFLAVACLLLTQQRWQLKSYKASLALQLSCLIGLMPLTLYWYSYGSLNGYLANLLAIPLVGFFIMPLALITMAVSVYSWAWIPMKILSLLIDVLFYLLHAVEHLAFLNMNWPLHSIELVLSLMAALFMRVLLPTRSFNWLALICFMLPWFPTRPLVKPAEALVHVLDVGQGLAIVVHTEKHTLIYDTGDQFFQGSDMGKMVILPYLQQMGVNTIDSIVISHPDKDHRGGLDSLETSLPVTQLLVNEPRYYTHGHKCHEYPDWEWDKVHFRFLAITQHFSDKNNNSCILQIKTKAGSILFTGDIEKAAEDYLIKKYGSELRSDVLIIPHHGSKTSSSYRFLIETAPKYTIASLGFANRFHFPHVKTINTLQALNIPFYQTDTCGMVEIKLLNEQTIAQPKCFN